jgi:hypothetical protein
MKSSLETVFDMLSLMLVLVFTLPIFLFMFHSLLYEADFGFGTLEDKSIMATPQQERDLYGDQYLADKRQLTNAHIALLPSVDDKEDETDSRTVTVKWDNPYVNLQHSYSLTEEAKTQKASLIGDGFSFVGDLTARGITSSYTSLLYHVSILADGSLILTETREEVK